MVGRVNSHSQTGYAAGNFQDQKGTNIGDVPNDIPAIYRVALAIFVGSVIGATIGLGIYANTTPEQCRSITLLQDCTMLSVVKEFALIGIAASILASFSG